MKTRMLCFSCLAIITVALSGCETTGVRALSVLGQVSPHTTPEEKAAWAAIGAAAQMEHEKEVAREGRTQVNVNVPQSSEGIPANLVKNPDGSWRPAKGYTWVNPNDPNDLNLKRVPGPSSLWDAYTDDGIKAANEKRFADAETLFKAALKEEEARDPKSPQMGLTLYWLGLAMQNQKKEAEANAVFSKAFSILDGHRNIKDQLKAKVLFKVVDTTKITEQNAAVAESQLKKMLALSEGSGDGKPEAFRANSHLYLARIYRARKDFKRAIAHYSACIDMFPEAPNGYFERAYCYGRFGEYGKELDDSKFAFKLESDNSKYSNGLAWFLSTCPVDSLRNGERAVEIATKAVEQTSRKAPEVLDTLAAAFAEAMDFDNAISVQEEAIALLTDPVKIEDYRKRLAIYKQGRPYREVD